MSGAAAVKGDEPPMYLQRPSSARSQDVSHVLARTFREFFTRDTVAPDTVQYLNTSRGGDNEYHERYVQALKQVQEEREQRLAEAAMLERHIMQAQARAMSADERAINRMPANSDQNFPDLGLPPARAHFRSCIDTALLKKHHLITPDDFSTKEIPLVPPPSAPGVPLYARETLSSSKKQDDAWETPLPSARDSLPSQHFESECDSVLSDGGALPPITDSSGVVYDTWKQQISAEEREMNRMELMNQQAKVDYLKNPRHLSPSVLGASLVKTQKKRPKDIGIKPKPEKASSKEPSIVFIASPPTVEFTDYCVGQVYELPLELKNVTTVMRPLRVVPPKTSYFSVGLGQFPGGQGLVAAGMSARYLVRFAPDSLGDFDDVLTIQTQSSNPITVRLTGQRPPPKLSLSSVINVGECLIGGAKVGQFHLKNTGGPGRFCMMPKSSWPSVNFKSVVSSGAVSIPPFEVRPPVFELRNGESTIIEVLYTPTKEESHEESMVIVCDNCQVQYCSVTGQGQVVGVELTDVEGGISEPLAGEQCDVTAQHIIRFENLNPYTYLQKTLAVKNLGNVSVDYDWIIVKPYIKLPDVENPDAAVAPPLERVQDVETVFSIKPDSGILEADMVTEFTLTFAPPFVSEFHDAFHLVLRNIPKVAPPPEIVKEPSNLELRRTESRQGTPSTPANKRKKPLDPVLEDVTSLEFEVKGECESLSVLLQPYAITNPGSTLVETLVKKPFKLINNSLSAVLFQWEHYSSSKYILEVEPPIGELAAQCEMDMELSFSGSEPGQIDHTLKCFVHHLEEPLSLHVQAEISGPEVSIEQADVNLGLVRLGEAAVTYLTLRNMCRVPANWYLREAPTHLVGEENLIPETEFVFEPDSGKLGPLEVREVTVTFRPRTCKSIRTVFELQVDDGNRSAILVRGEVQTPQVCFLSCELSLDQVYLDVPVVTMVTLLNQTLLPTTYQFGELQGKDAAISSATVEPSSGSLEPRQQLEVAVHFTAHRIGELEDLRLPCSIGEMDSPLTLVLYASVKGLSVSYRTPCLDTLEGESMPEAQVKTSEEKPEDEVLLDFGCGVTLGGVRNRHLYIKNNSGITAPFSLSVEYFFTKPPTPPEKPPGFMPSKSQRRTAMLAKTPNLADPLSKTPTKAQSDLARAMLAVERGAAFSVSPASGVLQPFGEQVVEVTAFNDMWGDYTDRLVCRVEKLDLVYVPMRLSVQGCPLHFQMMAALPSQQPILRCGTHVSGVAPVVRQMRINNPAPFDVRLDWQVFNKLSEDKQLLDLILAYDQAFPLRDTEGNELGPPQPAPPVVERQLTDCIPNTPDSTPVISRAETALEQRSPTPLELRRPKIIHVTLREHGGKMATNPYKLSPPQMVVPGRGNSYVSVSFTPLPSCEVTQETDCFGYALGYISLEDKVADCEDKVRRAQGYQINPLKLEMTAQVKPALLTIECDEDEGMTYCATASDLLDSRQMLPQVLKLCSTTLTNRTKMPLQFRLSTTEPFYIVQMDATRRQPTAQLLQTDPTSLRPQENAQVEVGFQVSLDLLEFLSLEEGGTTEYDGVRLETVGEERRLHFSQNLLVEFSNKTTQFLPLQASLILPTLVLSKESLDFGTCLVGQRREQQLILSNPTGCASLWSCIQERKSQTCEVDTFEVSPVSGLLDAYITHVSNSKVLIKVGFTAKHNEAYEAVYLCTGVLGEIPVRLHLQGQGSYDGKHEALVDI